MRFGKSGDRRIPWLELGLEAVLVVVSVLLALGLNSWRERRKHDGVVRESLHALRAEIVADRKQVKDRLAYHLALADTLRAHPRHAVALRPAFLLTDAWESARATGAVGYMDYPTAAALGKLYGLERLYHDLTLAALQGLYAASLSPTRAGGPDRTQWDVWQPILADFVSLETALDRQYDRTLDQIGEGTRGGRDTAAGGRADGDSARGHGPDADSAPGG